VEGNRVWPRAGKKRNNIEGVIRRKDTNLERSVDTAAFDSQAQSKERAE
jgi:hypothetical protein